MLKRFFGAVGLAVLILAAGGACAPALAQPSERPAPTARALELAKRMVKASGVEKQVDTVVTAMLPAVASQMSPNLSPENRALVTQTALEVLREDFTPKMLERMLPIYASTFSEGELEAMVAFYESPAGQSMQKKTPVLAAAISGLVQELNPEVQAEMLRRLCAKIDCKAERPKAS